MIFILEPPQRVKRLVGACDGTDWCPCRAAGPLGLKRNPRASSGLNHSRVLQSDHVYSAVLSAVLLLSEVNRGRRASPAWRRHSTSAIQDAVARRASGVPRRQDA